jgi:hypothetical protein
MYTISHIRREDAEWPGARKRLSNGRLLKGLCRGDVAADPIRRIYLADASGVLVAETTKRPKRVVGLLIYEVTDEYEPGPSLYVHVLCSRLPGVGTALMRKAQDVAAELSLRWLRLGALDHVIGYYRKLGFRATSHPQCREVGAVARAADRIAHLRFVSHNEAAADPRIQAARAAAIAHGQNLGEMILCLPTLSKNSR